jgi:hypothetical protein
MTYRSTAFLRRAPTSDVGKTLTLFVVSEGIYGVKLFAFLSQALRLAGWRVQVLLNDRSLVLQRAYFRVFGIQEFIYLEEISLGSKELERCRAKAEEFLSGPLSLPIVKSWTFEGCWIGPQIISTLSRMLYEGGIDFSRAKVRQLLNDSLTQTLAHVLKVRRLIQSHPSELALTIEANYTVFAPLVDTAIAKDCNVVQMSQPWRDDALTFRRLTSATRREHPSSVSRETLDLLVQRNWTDVEQKALDQIFEDRYSGRWFLQERNQKDTVRYTRDELIQHFRLDHKKRTSVVFSQVLWDANLFYGKDLFDDAGDWFIETLRAACINTNLNWLIKLHPANTWKRNYEQVNERLTELDLIEREIGSLPEHVILIAPDSEISTLSIFNLVDYGVTIRGTSGMELACLGKPCVTAGTGRYSGLGFTLDSETRQEYLQRLSNLQECSPLSDVELKRAKWHALAAFSLRQWPMKSAKAAFDYQDKGRKPHDHNLILTADCLEQLNRNGDLEQWGKWAEGEAIDFIQNIP